MRRTTVLAVASAFVSALMLGQARQQRPSHLTAREDAYRQNNVGVAHLEQYDYTTAASAFRRALEILPALAMARLNLAIALLYDGQLESAAQEARAAAATMLGSVRSVASTSCASWSSRNASAAVLFAETIRASVATCCRLSPRVVMSS